MPGNEGIAAALAGLGESGHSAKHTQMVKIRLATGQQLMDIRLVTHIKNQAVLGGIINGFDGHGQFHHAQIRGQMPPRLSHMGNDELPDLSAELLPLGIVELDQVIVTLNIR